MTNTILETVERERFVAFAEAAGFRAINPGKLWYKHYRGADGARLCLALIPMRDSMVILHFFSENEDGVEDIYTGRRWGVDGIQCEIDFALSMREDVVAED